MGKGAKDLICMAKTNLMAKPKCFIMKPIEKSHKLDHVCYDIRGRIHQEACRMEEEGVRILKLNIGNLATFGFEAPEEVVRDVVRNLPISQGYCES